MLDRVREAVFSTLGERVEGASVLDLFAGSGALGLECASRGASRVRCIERGARALATLKKNVAELGVEDRVRVIRADALDPRAWQEKDEPQVRWSLAFLDPPYPLVDDPAERAKLIAAVHTLFTTALAPGATIVLHVATRASETLRFGKELESEVRAYGSSAIVYVTSHTMRA